VREGNDPNANSYSRYWARSDNGALDHSEWIHAAGTYDGNAVKCYINGEVVDVCDTSNAIEYLSQEDTSGLAIGNRSDATNRPFRGTIDDVRVYNYGLSAAEVGYLASDGTGMVSVQSVANLWAWSRCSRSLICTTMRMLAIERSTSETLRSWRAATDWIPARAGMT
jgi:hypothetical protein